VAAEEAVAGYWLQERSPNLLDSSMHLQIPIFAFFFSISILSYNDYPLSFWSYVQMPFLNALSLALILTSVGSNHAAQSRDSDLRNVKRIKSRSTEPAPLVIPPSQYWSV
jgi:hypothetical protein